MPYLLRRRVWIANCASWCLIVVGFGYFAANYLQGYHHLVPHNLASILIGIVTMSLIWMKRSPSACAFLSLTCCILFTYGSLRFFNGTEDYLVINVMAAWFLMDRVWSRLVLAVVNSLAFIAVKLFQFPYFTGEQVPFDRYVITTVLVIVTASVVSEYIRRLDASYRGTIEDNSRKLAEANKAKERLFSIISHDLRGPVGNLKTTLDLLDDGHIDTTTVRELLPALSEDVRSTFDSLENLLYWSAQQVEGIHSRPQPVIVLRAVEETVALLKGMASSKNIVLHYEIETGAVASVDPEQLRTILRNLLSNALKFTPSGGSVGIASEHVGNMIQTVVSDTGIGIDPATAGALFDGSSTGSPGTAQEKGFGLGLGICRTFVELAHGRIWVEENPGGGARFCFTIPSA